MRLLFSFTKVCALSLLLIAGAMAQETTGGLQGTVKDPSGAVVPGAQVSVTGSTLVGSKVAETDSAGYYRFANLPPGTYALTVTAKGFRTIKRGGLTLEVGHLPTIDFRLEVGAATETVVVTAEASAIEVSTTANLTNLTDDVIANTPHGLSYQSMIQFAPMARNEPLGGYIANGAGSGGTGGSLPGSRGNGLTFGFSVGGGADSENGYLVEGQDTEQLSGGYSKANVPFEFIQEVQVKSSGLEAEYGGALGGVVNVVMKKGGNAYHGDLFTTYESDGLSANNNNIFLRYDPTDLGNAALGQDPRAQLYEPGKDHFRIVQPGFTVGGPILKDRLWFFLGFAPLYETQAKTVDFSSSSLPANVAAGKQLFTRDTQTYYASGRLDASLTKKIRTFASWLYQYARRTGDSLPISDPVKSSTGFANTSINSPLTAYSHGLGWAAPNATYNFGGDLTLSPKIVATTRFGYFFENYHSFGWQTTTPDLFWQTSGVGGCDNSSAAPSTACLTGGNPLPASLQLGNLTHTAPFLPSFTQFNANKHYQFNQDVAFFKGGWWGTHNIKLGYQLNHLVNRIFQDGNVPQALMFVGKGPSYSALTTFGGANCAALIAAYGKCTGRYGYLTVQDFATILPSPASDWNHAFFAQDSWTVGHGLTLSLGLRIEKESLPPPGGLKIRAIEFGWGDKIAPRLGAAWDPTGHGKMKIFGSYGVVNDVMKLLLAQSSWGAQAFEDCTYALGPNASGGFNVSDINLVFVNGRACPTAAPNVGAIFASGSTPASLSDTGSGTANTGVSLIENVNFRPAEPVAPGVKPYRQHEFVVGGDYQISTDWALEVRYDRRRLDHILEDGSLSDPVNFEIYTIVNPGEGVNRTIDGYASFLQSLGAAFLVPGPPPLVFTGGATFGTCPTCPPNPKAIRNYDGVEFRLTKRTSKHWAGLFSYTYSRLWGNYTGLTTTDQIDGNAPGRNSPDTTRSFDEPFYYFGANGRSTDGFLPTDRPNTFKGNVYYELPWKGMTTTFGLFQYAYQGTPVSSYTDLGSAFAGIPLEATYIFGRGNWVDLPTDASGNITIGTPHFRRSPWFTQSDFSVAHSFKLKERQTLRFGANFTNLFNQHAVLQYYQGFNSINFETPLQPGLVNGSAVSMFSGAGLYQVLESGYNPQQWINGNGGLAARVIKHSWYGQPQQFQLRRNLRLAVTFTF
jgi:uncharacterized protein (DUF779 family)